MSKKQEFYVGDELLWEVQTGVFAKVVVLKVIDIKDKLAFGEYRYVISPVGGRGEATVTSVNLEKNKMNKKMWEIKDVNANEITAGEIIKRNK